MTENYYGLVNKPPVDEIYNISLVNKPNLEDYDTDLAHFGILGMHWGVRRYQNPDGTLTDLGKKRLHNRLSKREKKIAKRIERARKKEYKKEEKFRKKREKILKDPSLLLKYEDMFSNDEIRKAKERILLLNDIDTIRLSKISKGKRYADNLLAYGNTLNSAIDFINSNAGKGIRDMLGYSTKDIFKYNKDSKKKKKDDDD